MQMEPERAYLAIYCILRQEDHVLMLKRQNTGYYDGQWSFPAGHVDQGESLTTAASRELKEETGLSVLEKDWCFYTMIHRRTVNRRVIDVFMETRDWKGEPVNSEPDKCDAVEYISITNTTLDIVDYIKPVFYSLKGNSVNSYEEWGWGN